MSNTSERRNRRKFSDEFKADAVAAPGPVSVREDATWPCVVVCAAWIAVLTARLWRPAGVLLLGLVSLGGLVLLVSTMDRTGLAWSVVALLTLIAPGFVLTATAIRYTAQ